MSSWPGTPGWVREARRLSLGVLHPSDCPDTTSRYEKCWFVSELHSVHKIVWIGALAVCAGTVSGSPVYDMAAAFTGTRSIGSGLTSGGGNAYDNLLLSWSIVQKANGTFDYSYAISGFTSPALGHLILETGPDCLSAGARCVVSAKIGGSLAALSPAAFQLGDWCYGTSANPGVRCQGNSNVGML